VDLVPFKTCTYDCVYCQLGPTTNKTVERREYVAVQPVLAELRDRLSETGPPDYVALAGSGEPTLHSGLGEVIAGIKLLTASPVAVLTNGSLLWRREVQDTLMEADLVLPSLDAGDEHLFTCVNRPHPAVSFSTMVAGLEDFRRRFRKPIWLEVFLLGGVTGIATEVDKIARIVDRIRPERVQLNTASRPPAEEYALPVSSEHLAAFAARFDPAAEVISERERSPAETNDGADRDADIMDLLSRRPCTVQDIAAGLQRHHGEVAKRVYALASQGLIEALPRRGKVFYHTTRAA
jgi:wyosine [tRNA(Phe)-imidazoG37] synthetase (radical SAM superfamily)